MCLCVCVVVGKENIGHKRNLDMYMEDSILKSSGKKNLEIGLFQMFVLYMSGKLSEEVEEYY